MDWKFFAYPHVLQHHNAKADTELQRITSRETYGFHLETLTSVFGRAELKRKALR